MSQWSILGSGVTALCAATVLYEHGERIEIIEQPTRVAASHWAGGMLAPYCEAEAAPAYITEQSLSSIAWWQTHCQTVHQAGSLVVAAARDQHELKRFASRTQAYEWLNPADKEPDLAHFAKALYFPTEAHLDPRLAMQELKEKLIQAGVNIHQGPPTAKIIDCRGIAAKEIQPQLRAVRGEMLILDNPYLTLQRPIRLLHPRFPCYLVPRGQGRFMLGATMVETEQESPITARSMMELLSAAYTIHPSFADASIIETGVGFRPAYPDNIPKLQYVEGRYVLNGMYRHGFLFAPVLAQQLIQHIQGHKND